LLRFGLAQSWHKIDLVFTPQNEFDADPLEDGLGRTVMAETSHTIMGGKVHLYRRGESDHWHCSTFLQGKKRRKSTREGSLNLAKEIAEDWYLGLRGQARSGMLKDEKTFRQAAEQFLKEYEIITEGNRSRKWVEGYGIRLRLHLLPFFGDLGISEITAGKVREYRMHRAMTPTVGSRRAPPKPKDGEPIPYKPPSRSTIHNEIVALRQVLKTALSHGWLEHLPNLEMPYRAQTKVSHRAWFGPEEYRQLYEATRRRARTPKRPRFKWEAEQLHDYVLFMANTGLRPDEAKNLQHRDVHIVEDEGSGERILEIEVRGKRGVGYCKSTIGAVRPYERLRDRAKPLVRERPRPTANGRAAIGESGERAAGGGAKALESEAPRPTDPVFPGNHIKMFNAILSETDLKTDRDGNRRTAYSLRHTYICMRLMEGADIYQIAKNCRTSVEMIEKFYAAHIKTVLDAAAINVRRVRGAARDVEAPLLSVGKQELH
jgi:integrase